MFVLVWWEDVCEDALTSKGLNTQLRVIGGGARSATDKIFQDNSLGGMLYPVVDASGASI
jgi:hypothetical protein